MLARQVLGLPQGVLLSEGQIKVAWKREAMKSHPDLGGSAERFVEVSRAVDLLRSLSGLVTTQSASKRSTVPVFSIAGPVRRPPMRRDSGYEDRQRALEEAYGHLGDWGRSGDGLLSLWHHLYGARRKG
jgi:curved DNA-binding protein CbpA